MKALLFLTILASAFTARADIPSKAPITRYTGLWTNSPFTSKPPPPKPGETVNPLEDFTLTGIAPVPGGYRITIMSKKNNELKKVIEPGRSSEFTVVSVNRNPDVALGTTVVLSAGSMQGTVSFEKEMLTLKAAPAPQPAAQPNNLPPGLNPAQANQPITNAANGGQNGANGAQRQPRPRIVPPPTPSNTGGQTQGGKPQQQEQRSNRRNK